MINNRLSNAASHDDLLDNKIPLSHEDGGETTPRSPSPVAAVSTVPYILFWVAASCTLILFNKAILSQYDFPYPMFLTFWHMLFGTICTQILARTTDMLPGVKAQKVDRGILIKKFFPIAFLYSISLICANRAYLYLSVSYIQMLKAFTPVCVLIASVLTGLEKAYVTEFMILFVVTLGVLIASYGELRFDATGFIFQVVSVACESTRLTLTNVTIKKLELDTLSTLYYIAPLACVCILIPFCIFEYATFPFERLKSPQFLLMLVVNGSIAFSLNIASVLVMMKASALILALSGIAKDVILVMLSMVVFASPVTPVQFFGYGVALAGLQVHKEYKKNPSAPFTCFTFTSGGKKKTGLEYDGSGGKKKTGQEYDVPVSASPNKMTAIIKKGGSQMV